MSIPWEIPVILPQQTKRVTFLKMTLEFDVSKKKGNTKNAFPKNTIHPCPFA